MVEGMVAVASRLAPAEALDHLSRIAAEKGLMIFAHIDHEAAAKAVGLNSVSHRAPNFRQRQSGNAGDAGGADRRH